MNRNISKNLFLKTDIIKIATLLMETIIKDSKKVKRINKNALKCNLYLYFLI